MAVDAILELDEGLDIVSTTKCKYFPNKKVTIEILGADYYNNDVDVILVKWSASKGLEIPRGS